MKKPIEIQTDLSIIEDLVGMEDNSIQKSYYPQLRQIIDELAREREKYLSVFNNAVNGILRIEKNGNIYDYNPAMALILGIENEQSQYNFIDDFLFDRTDMDFILQECSLGKSVTNGELNLKQRNGHAIITSLNAHMITIDERDIIEMFAQDITEKVRAEEKLRQSQKMEAIGKLAGGIAHDFNNLLTSIMGATDMLMSGEGTEDDLKNYGGIILSSSDMAVDLTSKLLAFSRQESVKKSEISLEDVVDASIAILERTLGHQIVLIKENRAKNDTIVGNKTELQNCLINLAVNGSHAMPSGGRLVISLENKTLTKYMARFIDPDLPDGDYILLGIRDMGTGIKESDLPHIFEPFFTTKEQGKGTGLGLSTVYGIIKEHGGHINVESEVGKGTLFTIYLPTSPE